jgi:2,3-bisphosphoglycerate-independent phosphoglycerate mutase
VKAVETTDTCLAKVVDAVERAGGVSIVIADHGNAEKLLQEDGVSPHTAHTTNPVPFILTASGATLCDGELADVAPTILGLLGIGAPSVMTGKNLAQVT